MHWVLGIFLITGTPHANYAIVDGEYRDAFPERIYHEEHFRTLAGCQHAELRWRRMIHLHQRLSAPHALPEFPPYVDQRNYYPVEFANFYGWEIAGCQPPDLDPK